MSKLVTSGNLAIFEYPSGGVDHEFTLDEEGTLWIFGYITPLAGKIIRVMKRFETGLRGYKVVGKHIDAKFEIRGNYNEMLFGLDEHRCLVMIKQSPNSEQEVQECDARDGEKSGEAGNKKPIGTITTNNDKRQIKF